MTEVNELPQCQSIPTFRGPAAALGWMYIIERPLLASAVIRGHLATQLPTEMAYASSVLHRVTPARSARCGGRSAKRWIASRATPMRSRTESSSRPTMRSARSVAGARSDLQRTRSGIRYAV